MVLPIGFFMPLPLAMMIPFMGIQSAVMAKQFGENFQYGKRRISAMSNEEFNKLTPKMIQDNANAELKAMIPSMEASVQEMRTFQTFLIKEFLRTLNDAIKAGFGELFGINDDTLSNIEHYLHGHGGGHDTTSTTTTSPPPSSETSGGTVGGVTLPPTEIDQPNPLVNGYEVIDGGDKYTTEYRTKFGSGRILKSATSSGTYLHTNTQIGTGKWFNLATITGISHGESIGDKTWPASGYFKVVPKVFPYQMYYFLNKYKL